MKRDVFYAMSEKHFLLIVKEEAESDWGNSASIQAQSAIVLILQQDNLFFTKRACFPIKLLSLQGLRSIIDHKPIDTI